MPAADPVPTTGRGRHHGWLAAVGVALMVGGVVAWYAQSPGADRVGRAPTSQAQVRDVAATPVRDAVRAPWVPGAPRRVVIPTLGVAAPVVPVRAPGGTLVPPADPQRLGWWAAGARPGARTGSALVTGHTVHTGGGALDDLETLRRGDRVAVGTSRGWIRYQVRRVGVYRKGSVAEHAEQLFSQEVRGRLVLVTCEDWNGTRYLSNVVVTATPVGGPSAR